MDSFSKEETALLHYFAGERRTVRIGFYISVLVTPLAFAAYGAWNWDVIAMLIAFLGQFAFLLWILMGDAKQSQTLRSISEKVLASLIQSQKQ